MEDILTRNLTGEKMSSVTFVLDYLQLDFDGPGFTMYIWPHIIYNGQILHYGDVEFRNGICGLIAKVVTRIEYVEDVLLKIIFDELNFIHCPIHPDNPEIFAGIGIYTDSEEKWYVFQ